MKGEPGVREGSGARTGVGVGGGNTGGGGGAGGAKSASGPGSTTDSTPTSGLYPTSTSTPPSTRRPPPLKPPKYLMARFARLSTQIQSTLLGLSPHVTLDPEFDPVPKRTERKMTRAEEEMESIRRRRDALMARARESVTGPPTVGGGTVDGVLDGYGGLGSKGRDGYAGMIEPLSTRPLDMANRGLDRGSGAGDGRPGNVMSRRPPIPSLSDTATGGYIDPSSWSTTLAAFSSTALEGSDSGSVGGGGGSGVGFDNGFPTSNPHFEYGVVGLEMADGYGNGSGHDRRSSVGLPAINGNGQLQSDTTLHMPFDLTNPTHLRLFQTDNPSSIGSSPTITGKPLAAYSGSMHGNGATNGNGPNSFPANDFQTLADSTGARTRENIAWLARAPFAQQQQDMQSLTNGMMDRCHGCGVETREWMKGPDGPGSLCILCGVSDLCLGIS